MASVPASAGEDEALAWRNQLALRLLRGLVSVFCLSFALVWLMVHGMRERYLLSGALLAMTSVAAWPVLTGRPTGRARAWMVIAPSVVMALSGYAFAGFLSGCGACLTVTMMLAGLLLGRRTMVVLMVICGLMLAVVAWAMVTGHLRAPQLSDSSMTSALAWTRSVGVTFLAIALFGGLMVAVVARMEHSLRLARQETLRREQAERVALDARQLELVGRLAAGVAHDFNNNLTSIMGCAELIQAEPAESDRRELAESILQASQRLAELTRQLLAYSRKARMLRTPTDLHQLVCDAVSLVRRSMDPNVRIVTDLAAGNPTVDADIALLQSALLNLLVNARDALPDGGTITVSTTVVDLPAGDGDGPAGPCVVLAVTDTGQGIAAEVLPQIFDPFFTTKPLGRGTGLGLAAVAGTIKAHGGRIQVDSAPGAGTTFRITLRVGEKDARALPSAGDDVVRGAGHILLVEDDGMVSLTALATLKSLGYETTHAPDGRAALELVRAAPRLYDLVLLDLRMPGMSGEATFGAMRELAPRLKVLIWSGFAAEQDVSSMLRRGAVGFVQKPYRVAALSRAIADAVRAS
jgi:signal transduction histidine kinase/ActR/RegA family two-component response regulator